ncbi:hypothetical protein RGE_31140 [Rubrivivax gelatinosus IL144]|uniref:Uncharacterized protein n=1 Tax=Rubrivivax gelatinosus (strain NBRC 100245 / IL144) TaxID=983917 RepID=I0HTW6_RUBGI|nr:hypothetical protein RGE_31140 [Rubrivivax gelatinosus IL144]
MSRERPAALAARAFSGPLYGRHSPRFPGSARVLRRIGTGFARAPFVSRLFRCLWQCNALSSFVADGGVAAACALVRARLECGPLGWVTRADAVPVLTRSRDNLRTNLVHGKTSSGHDPAGPGLPALTMFAAPDRFPFLHLCSRERRVHTSTLAHPPMRGASRPVGLGLSRP